MNATRRQDGRTQPGPAHPSPLALASFFVRSRAFQTKRFVEDAFASHRSLRLGTAAEFPFVIAESVSVLRTNIDVRERSLLLGKIQNLRVAAQTLHRRVLLPGEIFSFWRQVGAPWRMRGFKKGREVREGCVIPTTGGGLCQLSGALLEVASSIDCELVERHRHTALPADVAYDPRRDATIFWNYVDFRFRTPVPILFECYLTGEDLVVRVRGKSPQATTVQIESEPKQCVPLRIGASCYTCFKTACMRQCDPTSESNVEHCRTAFLIDEPQPEFQAYVRGLIRSSDQLLMQTSSWSTRRGQFHDRAKTFPLFRFQRAWKLRSTVSRGGTVAKAHFELAEVLAKTYCKHIAYDVEHLCIAQTLLPHLWKSGLLGGRSFDVLMYRLPINALEDKLDRALNCYPECRTLEEFRAPKWFAEAEQQALGAARRIVTPHPQIAALFSNSFRLAWKKSTDDSGAGSNGGTKDLVVFFGPTLARKGAYAVRDIARQMGFELTVVGSDLEGANFWSGLRVKRSGLAELSWHRIHTVLQPAIFEFWPRHLLRAHAGGSRLVISPDCGIEEDRNSGVYHVPFGDTKTAVAIMETLLTDRREMLCV